jgi:SSS family solute:Na+ symporter
VLGVDNQTGLWITVVVIGILGSVYAIFGGLKGVAVSDTLYGYGLLFGGLLIPILALIDIGAGNPITGLSKVFENSPEKFNVIGAPDSVLPFSTLFTGLVINQIYFWCMNQSIIQRAFGAKNLIEAQKGLLYTGVLKIFVPVIIVLPGVIGYYYFGDSLYSTQDMIYPELVKKVLPIGFAGFFAAVVMGAVLSTFNGVLNSAATIFSIDVYQRIFNTDAGDKKSVRVGKITASILAVAAIATAPFVANASEGMYQLLQQLNGIFFIPIASIMLGGFFFKQISATGAKVALVVGLVFYVVTTFILQVDIHFIHIWGIEFVLNVAIMFVFSYFYPAKKTFVIKDVKAVVLEEWKYTKAMSIALVVITVAIYVLLGQVM